jgi:bifunctional non-homologous end joining protein LigD
LTDGKNRFSVGNVTIPSKHSIPAEGVVVEIRYLYAYSGGSLYQPVYLGMRDDVQPSPCRLNQLKIKAEAGSETDDDPA